MLDRIAHLLRIRKPEIETRGLLWGSGTVVPTDGTDGWQVGSLFQHTDGGSGTALYVNEGSVTSCDFNPVDAGDLDTVLAVGEFSSVTAGSGIPLSSSQTAAAVVYGDDNGLAITANVYNLRTRLLLTVDQSATSIRALMAQLKFKDGVDVATGIYTANQGYLELAGTHIASAGSTLSCMDASLEIGTKLTVDAGGEACGLHVETTGSGTITNNGTCAGILVDKAAEAASWPVGLLIDGGSVRAGIAIGVQDTGVSLTTTYPFCIEVQSEANANIVAGATGLAGGFYSRYAIETAQTSTTSHVAVCGKLRIKANMEDGAHAALYGIVEASGTSTITGISTTVTAAGHFALSFGADTAIAAGHLNGIVVDSSLNAGCDISAATVSAIRVKKTGSAASWPVGIEIEPTSCVAGITLGQEKFLTTESGYGLHLDGVTTNYGCSFHFDDGGTELESGWSEGVRSGYLVTQNITDNDVSIHSFHGYVYVAAASCSSKGGFAGVEGSFLAKAGTTITNSVGVCDFTGGHFSCNVPSTAVIGASTWACGVSVGGNLGGTHTGKAAGYRVRVPSAGKWDVGLRIEPTSCVYAYQVGEGKYAAADYGYGIPLSSASQHSGAEMYFDDGGVMLTAGYIEAVMTGFLVSQAITTADVSLYTAHDYVYLAADVTTAGGVGAAWASMLVKTGVTITTSSGICDFSAFNATCDVPTGATIGVNTFVSGLSIGGNMGGTKTDSTSIAIGIRLRPAYNGDWDGLFDIPTEIRVETADAAADVEGSIKIYINGVAKYLQYWPNPTT